MVRLGMSATDAPVLAKEPVHALNDWASGAISGWLVMEAGALRRCDAGFARCEAGLIAVTGGVLVEAGLPGSDSLLLDIDGALYVYDSTANTLSAPIYTLIGNEFTDSVLADKEKYYLTFNSSTGGPKTIYTAPIDGSAQATELLSDSAFIDSFDISGDTLVYRTDTEIKSVAKTGGVAVSLVTARSSDLYWFFQVHGTYVYYNFTSDEGVASAGVVDVDGNNKSATANATWTGAYFGTTFDTNDGFKLPEVTLIRADGVRPAGAGDVTMAGASLRSFDAVSHTEMAALGTVPADIVSLGCFGLADASALCAGSNTSHFSDVFYLNVATPGSFVRVTDTPAKSETAL